ncbi:unnamed protein product [Aphanomyces euteiches]|uniref:Rhodanese domain-containing protein n=2 Tax=Aphanomyces euteiches TaxID=100861 RepID=A0A6G0X962_9STRA|nr:hypothetical protein Ae201684_007503 [Aphanomyces euteiches]KAH9100560.1 hypothetical protein Ae201684P_006756 [Aphanomyces euteiches]KAH9156803.1 hypothetical protein AeRB84_001299 [Aphanomyces euteiches]
MSWLAAAGGVAIAGVGVFALKQHMEKVNFDKYTKPDLVLEVRLSSVAPSRDRHTVLVTGGNGFLGSYVVRQLIAKGTYNVIVFDISLPRGHALHPEVTYVQGNLLKPDHVKAALQVFAPVGISVQSVIHVASLIPSLPATLRVSEAVNVEGTRNVLDACAACKVSSLVYTSSVSVILPPNNLEIRKASEDMTDYPEHNIDTYAHTKAEAERKVLAANTAALATCSLRPSAIFGKGIFLVDEILRRGLKNIVVGDGKFLNDFVAVEDVANAHVLALEALQTREGRGRVGGQAYFIGGGEELEFSWFRGIGTHGRNDPSLTHWERPPPKQIPLWLVESFAWVNEIVFALSGAVLVDSHLSVSALQYMKRTYTFSIAKAKRDLAYAPQHTVAEKIAMLVADHTKAKAE